MFTTKERVLVIKPENFPSFEQRFHYRVFFPSCSLSSITKNRAGPYVTTSNIFLISIGLWQQLHWCWPSNYVWPPILNPDCMFCGKGKQQNIINPMLNPMQQNMNHKGVSHIHYCLGNALCLEIVMLCTDVTKTL